MRYSIRVVRPDTDSPFVDLEKGELVAGANGSYLVILTPADPDADVCGFIWSTMSGGKRTAFRCVQPLDENRFHNGHHEAGGNPSTPALACDFPRPS